MQRFRRGLYRLPRRGTCMCAVGELCSLCCIGALVLSVAVAVWAARLCGRVWCGPCMQYVQAGRMVCLQALQQCAQAPGLSLSCCGQG